ncbi:MAG: RsmD family RNA methyltransferase [Actinomycetota bacterium]
MAGAAGGLRLESPAGATTRPTAERVREAVFSAIGGAARGASVLDLYAGTGALAIEALSRGASRALLVERDHREADVCRRNLERTGFADAARVLEDDVDRFLVRPAPPEAPFGVVCCDAPYSVPDAAIDAVLAGLDAPGWCEPSALVAVERPLGSRCLAPPAWEHRFSRSYGDTLVHLWSTGASGPATRPDA